MILNSVKQAHVNCPYCHSLHYLFPSEIRVYYENNEGVLCRQCHKVFKILPLVQAEIKMTAVALNKKRITPTSAILVRKGEFLYENGKKVTDFARVGNKRDLGLKLKLEEVNPDKHDDKVFTTNNWVGRYTLETRLRKHTKLMPDATFIQTIPENTPILLWYDSHTIKFKFTHIF